MILEKGPAFKALATKLRGQIVNVSAPSKAPPELARLVVRIERGVFQVGLNRFQFVVQPPPHIEQSYQESLAYAANLAERSLADLYKDGLPEFQWTGIVTALNYPASHPEVLSHLDAVRPVFERLTTLNWPSSDLASFSLRVGREQDGFFRNYAVAGYSMKEVQVKVPAGQQSVKVDLGAAEVSESGLGIVLDVNSRPSRSTISPLDDLNRVLAEHQKAFGTLVSDLNLTGII